MDNNKETILIAGGTGLVGKALCSIIDYRKYEVIMLSRKVFPNTDKVTYVQWNPDTNEMPVHLTNIDHIINLAGAGIADSRWTDDRKKELVSSRVDSAASIAKLLQIKKVKPKTYISASAIGYYGDRGAEVLNESSIPGNEFMSSCCTQWEDAAKSTGKYCERTVIMRIGIVLSTLGGALPKMLMTKGLGVYNYFGDGKQYYGWLHIHDLCRLIMAAIENSNFEGVYNAVAPDQITNKEMMSQIMTSLGSNGFLLPAPTFALRIALGEMANVVLNSNRVVSERIKMTGFTYEFTKVGEAVKDLISREM